MTRKEKPVGNNFFGSSIDSKLPQDIQPVPGQGTGPDERSLPIDDSDILSKKQITQIIKEQYELEHPYD